MNVGGITCQALILLEIFLEENEERGKRWKEREERGKIAIQLEKSLSSRFLGRVPS
jgi:hypothetical protein